LSIEQGVTETRSLAGDGEGRGTLATLKGDEIITPGSSIKDDVRAARMWFNEHLKPLTVRSAALGRDVKFTSSGRDKSTSLAGDRRKLAILPALPELIREGRLERSELSADPMNTALKAVHRLDGEVLLGGQTLIAHIVIRETTGGLFHYDHYIV
jgi:hypothetical protein